jgi:hypothetical protein
MGHETNAHTNRDLEYKSMGKSEHPTSPISIARERLFHWCADCIQESMDVPPQLAYTLLLGYDLVMFLLLTDFAEMQMGINLWATTGEVVLIITCLFTLFVVIIDVLVILTPVRSWISRETRFSIYMTIAFTYIVYPLLVWTASAAFFSYILHKAPLWPVIVTWLSIPLGMAHLFLSQSLMKDTLPSKYSPLAGLDNRRELLCHILNTLMIIMASFNQSAQRNVTVQTLTITVTLPLFIFIVIENFGAWVFWKEVSNDIFTCGSLVINVVKLLYDLVRLGVLPRPSMLVLLCFMAILIKLALNMNGRACLIKIFDLTISPARRKQGMLYLDDLWVRFNSQSLTDPVELHRFYFYRGQVLNYLEDANMAGMTEAEVNRIYNDPYYFLLFYMQRLNSEDRDLLELHLLLQLTCILPQLATFKQTFLKFSLFAKKHKTANFKYFYLMRLFKMKLTVMYKGKLKEERSRNLSIKREYESLHRLDKGSESEDFLDIGLPIRIKHQYIDLCNLIQESIGFQLEIYNLLSFSRKQSYKKLFKYNRHNFSQCEKIRQVINQRIKESGQVCPTFFILGAMVYYRSVRFSFDESKLLLQLYKTRSSAIKGTNTIGQITMKNLLNHSATLEVSVQRGSIGDITGYSKQFSEVLGDPGEETNIIGRSINELFPEALRELHKYYMENFQSFMQLGAERSFFIQGFDGVLKEVKFIVKIQPSISRVMTALAYVRPFTVQDKCLIVVNNDFEIISAQEKFWRLIEACPVDELLNNLMGFCSKLCKTINLLKAFRSYSRISTEKSQLKMRILKRDLGEAFAQFDSFNKGHGLEFPLDPNSAFSDYLPGVSLLVNLEFVNFKDLELTKIYCRFEMKSKAELQQSLTKIESMRKVAFESTSFRKLDRRDNGVPIDDTISYDKMSIMKRELYSRGTYSSPSFNLKLDFVERDHEIPANLNTKKIEEFSEELYEVFSKGDHLDLLEEDKSAKNPELKKIIDIILSFRIEDNLMIHGSPRGYVDSKGRYRRRQKLNKIEVVKPVPSQESLLTFGGQGIINVQALQNKDNTSLPMVPLMMGFGSQPFSASQKILEPASSQPLDSIAKVMIAPTDVPLNGPRKIDDGCVVKLMEMDSKPYKGRSSNRRISFARTKVSSKNSGRDPSTPSRLSRTKDGFVSGSIAKSSVRKIFKFDQNVNAEGAIDSKLSSSNESQGKVGNKAKLSNITNNNHSGNLNELQLTGKKKSSSAKGDSNESPHAFSPEQTSHKILNLLTKLESRPARKSLASNGVPAFLQEFLQGSMVEVY